GLVGEVGPRTWDNRFGAVSSGLRTALAASVTVAAFLIAAWAALRPRQRELLDVASLIAVRFAPDAAAILPPAAVLRARAARVAAGVMAVVWTLALLVITHNPFGYTDRRGLGYGPDDGWWRWLFEDHLAVVAVIAVLLFAAYRVGDWLADRALRRAIMRLADLDRDVPDLARRLARRLDGWSVALGFAGMIALVL